MAAFMPFPSDKGRMLHSINRLPASDLYRGLTGIDDGHRISELLRMNGGTHIFWLGTLFDSIEVDDRWVPTSVNTLIGWCRQHPLRTCLRSDEMQRQAVSRHRNRKLLRLLQCGILVILAIPPVEVHSRRTVSFAFELLSNLALN